MITCLLQVEDLDVVIKGLAADNNIMLQECQYNVCRYPTNFLITLNSLISLQMLVGRPAGWGRRPKYRSFPAVVTYHVISP